MKIYGKYFGWGLFFYFYIFSVPTRANLHVFYVLTNYSLCKADPRVFHSTQSAGVTRDEQRKGGLWL